MFSFTKPSQKVQRQEANQLYGMAVAQARDPHFYRDIGVEDTPDGRLSLISLHVYLVLSRLQALRPSADASGATSKLAPADRGDDGERALSQEIVDLFVDDLDQAMREIGIGDMGVGRRVKKAMEQFFEISRRLKKAHLEGDGAVADVLVEIVPGLNASGTSAAQLATYLKTATQQLQQIPRDQLPSTVPLFPDV